MGDILEIQFKYDGHVVVFLYNVEDINAFKASIDYKSFYEIFGCSLSINPKNDSRRVTISNNTIYLSVEEKEDFKKENFQIGLSRIMKLLNIEKKVREEILENIMNSIPKSNKKIMYHSIVIINDGLKQRIKFYYLILSQSEFKEYNYLLNNGSI